MEEREFKRLVADLTSSPTEDGKSKLLLPAISSLVDRGDAESWIRIRTLSQMPENRVSLLKIPDFAVEAMRVAENGPAAIKEVAWRVLRNLARAKENHVPLFHSSRLIEDARKAIEHGETNEIPSI